MDSLRTQRHWQNLIHGKCPDCDLKMTEHPGNYGFMCPDDTCSFFISKKTMIKILTDPSHAAIRFATDHEKKTLAEALKRMGWDKI